MKQVQIKENMENNQNSTSSGGTISQMIMESSLMQQKEKEHNEMFGEANQLMAKDSNTPIQMINAQVGGIGDITQHNTLFSVAQKFGINDLATIKNALFNKFATNVRIPSSYMDNAMTIDDTKKEVIKMLNDLVKASNGTINANSGDNNAFINQLYNAVSNLINDNFVATYPYLKKANAFENKYRNYLRKIRAIGRKIDDFEQEKTTAENDYVNYSAEKIKKKKYKLKKLKKARNTLETELTTAVDNQTDTDEILTKIDNLVAQIDTFESNWESAGELEYRLSNENISNKLDTFVTNSNNERVTNHYGDEGGVDDGQSVGYDYKSILACSLYALLALKPNWMGADSPEKLHNILRETKKLNDYDENKKVAYIRYLAGLTPTAQNQNLGQFLDGRVNDTSSFIVDPTDQAHTFAVVYKQNQYKKVDNETPNGGNIDRSIKLAVTWK